MKRIMFVVIAFALAIGAYAVGSAEKKAKNSKSEYVKVIYFHTDYRCATCNKLEKYSEAALKKYFPKQLKSGEIRWETINYEEKANEKYVDQYRLFNKSLIIVKVVDGKETEWKNCSKIWELVSDKTKYYEYVKKEVKDYLGGK